MKSLVLQMDSIMQSKRECYITQAEFNLHKHHIYFGANRQVSEDNGLWVWLYAGLHNGETNGVHNKNGHELDMKLKQECQAKFEETHTRQEFRDLIGKSYL